MKKSILLIASINGFLVVALGAFGAHGLESVLSAQSLETWATAVQYHMFHTLALMLSGSLIGKRESSLLKNSAIAFVAGIILFSGSLYLLALSGISWLGMITPLGGVAFLAGWACLAWQQITGKQ